MENLNMSKLYLSKGKVYIDVNGNKVGDVEHGLTQDARKYLTSKYGEEYTKRTDFNMLNGNIYQDNKWRANDLSSSKNTKL